MLVRAEPANEPSLVGAALRRWWLVAVFALVAIAGLFAADALRGVTTAAEAMIVVRQPGEIASEQTRIERFVREQAALIASLPLAESVSSEVGLTPEEVHSGTRVFHDIEENRIFVRFEVPGVGEEADELAIAGANALIDHYVATYETIVDGDREWRLANARAQVGVVAATAELFALEPDDAGAGYAYIYGSRAQRLAVELHDLETERLALSQPIRLFEPADFSFVRSVAGARPNQALALVTGVFVGAVLAYLIELGRWSRHVNEMAASST